MGVKFNPAYESEPRAAGLIGYVLNSERALKPPPRQGGMIDYILAGDGLYLRAEREEMDVCFQIAAAEVRGLGECNDTFEFRLPKVPESLMLALWRRADQLANDRLETLFHLVWSPVYPWDEGWEVVEPEQTRTSISCQPDGICTSSERAIIEIHSHHVMPPDFSETDDKDETGFRLYGVLGDLDQAPKIRLRVGVYGYHYEIPASWAFEVPHGLMDCNSDLPTESSYIDEELKRVRVQEEVEEWS
jgi:PRTRC genetic system protein A